MVACAEIPEKIIFSEAAINEHLEKIFSDRMFGTSDILKRFLSFIVKETVEGRSHQLKEYTIGVGVLHKPLDFKPQQDAIVRIHAGRLRRALNHFYKENGAKGAIRISIPKGSYVPVFTTANTDTVTEMIPYEARANSPMVVAVMPFAYFEKGKSAISLVEGLASQLTTELTHNKNLSVIAYDTMRRLSQKIMDVRDVSGAVGARYVFAGNIQHQDGRIRIIAQMINTSNSEQVWSQVFERRLTGVNMFDIQDEVVGQIISTFETYFGAKRPKLKVVS